MSYKKINDTRIIQKKKYIILFLLLFLCKKISADNETNNNESIRNTKVITKKEELDNKKDSLTVNIYIPESYGPKVVNKITNESNQKTSQLTGIDTTNDNTSNATAVNKNNSSLFFQNLLLQYKQIVKDVTSSYVEKFKTYLLENKKKCALLLFFSSGLFITYRCKKAIALLSSPDAWCCWYNQASLKDLALEKKDILIEKLLFDIKKKYLTIKNMEDQTLSHTSSLYFIKTIDRELAFIQTYIKIIEKTPKIFFTFLFFIPTQYLSLAKEKYERLLFIKEIFLQWYFKKCEQY